LPHRFVIPVHYFDCALERHTLQCTKDLIIAWDASRNKSGQLYSVRYNARNMGFIEFPFIEVPEDLRKIVGEPTPGTRAYRREGTHAECGQWIEDLGLHYKGDVGISPAGVTMFVPVQRAAVHKRIKEGKLTAFFFYITNIESTFFGTKRKVKLRPYIVLSVSECKAWAAEMKRRLGYVDEPGETPMTQSERVLQAGGGGEEPKTPKEAKEVLDFAETDPKDKGNRKVRYEEALSTDNRQQDMFLLLMEAMAAMASGKKAELYRKRLEQGMEWDKKNKAWKWKDEDEYGK
jgi:hypothetical protein